MKIYIDRGMFTLKNLKFFNISVIILSIFFPISSYGSETDGTIDSTNKYAHGYESNVGLINFGLAAGNVHVTDSLMTGYAWGEKIGWINLAPTYGGVSNNGEGVLSGYAWGELAGWINFNPTLGGVTIDSSGDFSGSAWSQNFGWIVFNCSTDSTCGSQNIKVSTDWRPRSARAACNNATDDDGDGSTDYPADSGCSSLTDTSEVNTVTGGGGIITPPPPPPPPPPPTPPSDPLPPQDEPPLPPPQDLNPPAPPSDSGGGSGDSGGSGQEPSSSGGSGGGEGSATPQGSGSSSGGGGGMINNIVESVTPAFLENAVDQAISVVSSAYAETKKVFVETSKKVAKVVDTPTGNVVTKTVSTVGVVSGTVAVASNAFLTGLSFSELIFFPLRLWTLLLSFLGLKRKYRPWGTVYDSVTKQPLDPAYVSLLDQNGKEVTSSITDLDGRYGFLLGPGIYKIVASKTNYTFPSKKLLGKVQDELYSDLYFGEPFAVGQYGEVVIRNIPMDQDGFDWNEFAKRQKSLTLFYSKKDLWAGRIINGLFFVGFVSAIISLFAVPEPYNTIIFAFYGLILILRVTGLKSKTAGIIKDGKTGVPLSFAIVTVFSEAIDRKIMEKVADKYGKYYCLVPPGDYYITIQKKNDDESYTQVYKSPVFHSKKGVINGNIDII